MRQCFSVLAFLTVIFGTTASYAQSSPCPFREEGTYPWSANIPRIMSGDLWAWVYLDLDKKGRPLRCYIGQTNISGDETRANLCRSFVSGWKATPLMKDGVPVAGTTRRQVIIIGSRHKKVFDEARAAWFAQHPDENRACYNGTANQ